MLQRIKWKLHLYIILVIILFLVLIPFTKNCYSVESNSIDLLDSSHSDGNPNSRYFSTRGDLDYKYETKNFTIDFHDKSIINLTDHVIINTNTGKAKLMYINRSYGIRDANCIQPTNDGGYILVGTKSSYMKYDDILLVKLDDAGIITWKKTFGSSDSESGFYVQQTNDGGYIVTANLRPSFPPYNDEILLVKFDKNGNSTWNKTIGTEETDKDALIQQTKDGGYIIGAISYNNYFQDYQHHNRDIWIVKTDNQGNVIWNTTYGKCDDDRCLYVEETLDGGFVAFCTGEGSWILKADSNGRLLWNRSFNGYLHGYGGLCLETSDGGFIVTCGRHISKSRSYEVCLVKLNSLGIEQWNKTYGGTHMDFGYSLDRTYEGGYIITGKTYSYGAGGQDIWLSRTDKDGNELWNRTYGDAEDQYGEYVQQTSDGGFILLCYPNTYIIKTDSKGEFSTIGNLFTFNVLKGINTTSIDAVNYRAHIPEKSSLKAQFSNDNENWYISWGSLNRLDRLKDGNTTVDLSELKWNGSNLFCRVNFETEFENIPVLDQIDISYTIKVLIDTDSDGIPDNKDTDDDNDGFLDKWEEIVNTDPKDFNDKPYDNDNDSLPDGYFSISELWMDTDDDNDNIPDDWEIINKLNPEDPADASLDFDHDGFSNLNEYLNNTDPYKYNKNESERVNEEFKYSNYVVYVVAGIIIIAILILSAIYYNSKFKKI